MKKTDNAIRKPWEQSQMFNNPKFFGYKIENNRIIISDGASFEELEKKGYIIADNLNNPLKTIENAYKSACYERRKILMNSRREYVKKTNLYGTM